VTPSAAALLAAANDWLAPLVGGARQILLVSHHQTKPGGLPFGLVISRSTIDPGTAWAILAVAQIGSWEVCEISSLALDDEDPSERVWGLSPYELRTNGWNMERNRRPAPWSRSTGIGKGSPRYGLGTHRPIACGLAPIS